MIITVNLALDFTNTRRLDRELCRILQYAPLSPILASQQLASGVLVISSLPYLLAQSSRDQIIPEEDNRIIRFCTTFCQITVDIPIILIRHIRSRNGRSIISCVRDDMCRHGRIYVTSLLVALNGNHDQRVLQMGRLEGRAISWGNSHSRPR